MERQILVPRVGFAGERGHRIAVHTVLAGHRTLVHLRIRSGSGRSVKPSDTIDLILKQADALMRALRHAIEVAETNPLLGSAREDFEPGEDRK